jgi:hypothetical protein
MNSPAYGGDPFAYDFQAALEQAKERQRTKRKRAEHEFTNAAAVCTRQQSPKSPTGEQLRRHADRFGPDGVNETAVVYGVDLRVYETERREKRHRRTSSTLRSNVIELRARRLVDTAIADALNIADRRVREILNRSAAA